MANENTIQTLFEKYVTHFPSHIAVLNGDQSLTYNELNKRANQLAHYLQKLGVQSDTFVGLCLERSFDFLIALIAILKAGGAYLPLESSQPEERLKFLLKDSKTPILITKSIFKDKFMPYEGTFVLLDKDEHIDKQATDNPNSATNPEHLAYIIYTSGSTGTPKGVLIEHHAVVNYGLWFAQYTQCKPQQRIDFSANPIFDMSVTTTIVPLMLGLTIVICDDVVKKNIREYLRYLAKSHVDIIKLTPSYFKVLLLETKNNFNPLPQLHNIILGGENLSTVACQSWLKLYPQHILFNEYGPTETTVAATVFKVNSLNVADLGINVPIGTEGTNMSTIILNSAVESTTDAYCTDSSGLCADFLSHRMGDTPSIKNQQKGQNNQHIRHPRDDSIAEFRIILDSNNLPNPNKDEGELCISGACLARGYLNQPQLTQKQFILINDTRFYKTGDLCKKHSDGTIEYLGRMDEQVKIRGFRIEPGEIEKHLAHYPVLREVAVVAQKDSFDDQRLVVYYVLKGHDNLLHTNQIRHYLQKHLPDYMIPTVFVKMNHLPLTANGKLDKAALPMPFLNATHDYLEPETALEKKIAQIWSEELGVALISTHDDFFDLGGHSLSAARIVSKINDALGKNISLHDFYQAANIAKLISVIKRTKKINKKKHALNKPYYYKTVCIPLSDFQFLLWIANTFSPRVKKLNIVARKRLQGRLDKNALEFSLQAILKKHETLSYQILKLQPAQKVQENLSLNLIVHHLELLSPKHREEELQKSITQLINFHPWPKNSPLIRVKLFYLEEDESELQICMSHMISDDYCMDILFADLSQFYMNYNQLILKEINKDSHFKKYIFNAREMMKKHLDKDILFWEEYLRDSSLFTFPKKYIVTNMHAKQLPYSTYSIIPKYTLNHFKRFCEQNHIGVNNALCAAIALALRNCCGGYESKTPYTHINIIQSTRDNPIYDKTIGCFLRVEPVKIILDNTATLTTLSQQIRQSTIDTCDHQQCPNLAKLSAVSSFKPNGIENFFIKRITPLYTKLLKIPSLYRKILQRCGSRMISFKRNTNFFININIRGNFIAEPNKDIELFGFNTKLILNNEDLLAVDYVFEASFFHDNVQKEYCMVLSANLNPEFRKIIAQEVFHIILNSAVES